jgi:hypothetical protein
MTIYSRSAAVRPSDSYSTPKPEGVRPHFRVCVCIRYYRSRIAKRGQLQHYLDARARASHHADIFILRYRRRLPRDAHGG